MHEIGSVKSGKKVGGAPSNKGRQNSKKSNRMREIIKDNKNESPLKRVSSRSKITN